MEIITSISSAIVTVVTLVAYMEHRFSKLDGKIDRVEARLETRIQHVDDRVFDLQGRLGTVEQRPQ